MRRREFLALLGGIAIAARPGMGRAQHPGRTRRIAILLGVAESDPEAQSRVGALRQELERLGWVDGRNIRIEQRWTGGDAERLRAYTAELVASAPDVIVANPTPIVAALREATRTIPIVFALVSDPVSSGFVESWAQPGGNITGFTNFESSMAGKWVELLKEIAPDLTRVAFLFNPQTAAGGGSYFLRPIDAAVSTLKVKPVMELVHDDDEIEAAFAALAREPGAGVVLLPDVFTVAHYQLVVALAARYRVPTVYTYRFMAERGGLISYGVDIDNLFERAATYVDRILKGAKPADLPVQAPTRFELVINQKTAKALGLTVPHTLLARAEEVIE